MTSNQSRTLVILGKTNATVGHDMQSCTVHIQEVQITDPEITGIVAIPNPSLLIIDTPGFDDTKKDDVVILTRIAKWLKKSHGIHSLVGVIYLHDISLDRFTGTAKRNLDMFQKLCGKKAFKNVAIGMTKGSRVNDSGALQRRTESLKRTQWNHMIAEGVTVFSIPEKDSREDSRKVVKHLLSNYSQSTVLQIQDELIKKKLLVPNTEAGLELSATIKRLIDAHKQYTQFSTASNLEEAKREIERLSKQLKELKIPLSKRIMSL
ncbi:hypothetical protein JR316_0000036 [Psilocybe cubensis]|uniref:Uncharacterized protein n=1 Tax=Psilocybe cubensis TaxID=181762 RepID=A0ACB8HFL8_PSICU|nr:hypothetical protein JR316_0000036 [Psilocybe cubensis]KAH9485974.1 hypothetical protein JR316_0000036 [Psilocybe cubensis]